MWFRVVLAISIIAMLSLVWLLFAPTRVATPLGTGMPAAVEKQSK